MALISLICLGLVALAGFFAFARSNSSQVQAQVTQLPPTAIPATFTPTATSSATPTETPLPTPTATSVLGGGGGTEAPVDTPTIDPNATATNTAVLQTPTLTATLEPTATPTLPSEEIPESGGVLSIARHSFLVWIGTGLLLVLIIYGVLNRFKPLSQDSRK